MGGAPFKAVIAPLTQFPLANGFYWKCHSPPLSHTPRLSQRPNPELSPVSPQCSEFFSLRQPNSELLPTSLKEISQKTCRKGRNGKKNAHTHSYTYMHASTYTHIPRSFCPLWPLLIRTITFLAISWTQSGLAKQPSFLIQISYTGGRIGVEWGWREGEGSQISKTSYPQVFFILKYPWISLEGWEWVGG